MAFVKHKRPCSGDPPKPPRSALNGRLPEERCAPKYAVDN